MSAALTPDREALASFCAAVFKHADPAGFVSLRGFPDNGKSNKAIFVDPIVLKEKNFLNCVFIRAEQAATWSRPVVFCPPLMTFKTPKDAKTENVLDGLVLTVECDKQAQTARATLSKLLGEPTIIVASGGEWQNPKTGEIEPKLHLHWRLATPTRSPQDHLLLREARDIASKLVGSDASAVPLVHPLRWPGSWHRKAVAKIATIVSETENEIDLRAKLDDLREAAGSTGESASAPKNLKAENEGDVALALRAIPNVDLPWDEWNKIGMAVWASTAGSDVGLKAFDEWSAKSKKHDPAATAERWQHYPKSPPGRIGFGTLVYLARKHSPGWTLHADSSMAVDPIDLWAKFDPPSLPRGVMPDIIERFAIDQGRAMGADISGVAVSALAVCAAAIPDKIQLQVKRHNTGWLESARLWVALVGPPSTMKSPILSAAVRPIRKIDSDMARRYSEARAKYDKLPADERKQTDPPKQTRILLQDTTIEAAQEIIKDSPDGMLCYQDEMSGWFGSMDKYSGARGSAKDRAFWLEAFNGAPYSVNRVGRGSVFIENLSVSILGGIQPEPIRKLADESMDDGLLQRLLPIILRPAVEGRDDPTSDEVAEYGELINRLHNLHCPMLGGIMADATTLQFEDEAQVIRQELERKHLELQTCEAINRKLAAHIGKYNGIFARLCVVWHCVECAGGKMPTHISTATAKRAAGFLHGFLLPHAVAFYAGVLGLSNEHDRLTSIAGYILAHKLERITNRDVQRGDRTMRSLERRDIESVFDQLDALGWISRTPATRPTDPTHWRVNPAVHGKFAERALAERQRREIERNTIADIMRGGRAA